MAESLTQRQIVPLVLTGVIAFVLAVLIWVEIKILNVFTPTDIITTIKWWDVLVGLTIYLKTSIDFAIFIGNLMQQNPGYKRRISIEIGTAVGNAAGTMAILLVWTFFKEIRWLLALMVFIAALVLFKLAEEGLEHAKDEDNLFPRWFRHLVSVLEYSLDRINKLIAPVLRYVIPNLSMKAGSNLKFWPLFSFSFTIPFILGLDDFAGYVPLFTVVNVFGFSVGVLLGHMVLNIFLYLSPHHTIKAVKNPIIALLGSLAFIGLAIWGLIEVARIIGH